MPPRPADVPADRPADAFSRRAVVGLGVGGFAALLTACTGEPTRVVATSTGDRSSSGTGGSGPSGSATSGPTESATASITATLAPPAGTLNALIVGSDSRSSALEQGSSDVIVLVQLSEDRTRLNLVSAARDTLVNWPGGGRGKINAIYPRSGPQALANTMSRLLGDIEIHYIVETGFTRFIQLSEALGGFTVQNRHASSSSQVPFSAGPVRLQGRNSLIYVRERKGLPNGDLDRTERHRAALTGMLWRLQEIESQGRILQVLPALFQKVRSKNFSPELAAGFVPVLRQLSRTSVTSVMVPISRFDMVGGASVDILNQARTAELATAVRAGDLSGYVAKYGTSNAPTG